MRVMLQNWDTGLFYAGRDKWKSDLVQALHFESVPHAVKVYKQQRVAFVTLLVWDGPELGHGPLQLPDVARRGRKRVMRR